jgi:hypothetical protein
VAAAADDADMHRTAAAAEAISFVIGIGSWRWRTQYPRRES